MRVEIFVTLNEAANVTNDTNFILLMIPIWWLCSVELLITSQSFILERYKLNTGQKKIFIVIWNLACKMFSNSFSIKQRNQDYLEKVKRSKYWQRASLASKKIEYIINLMSKCKSQYIFFCLARKGLKIILIYKNLESPLHWLLRIELSN